MQLCVKNGFKKLLKTAKTGSKIMVPKPDKIW